VLHEILERLSEVVVGYQRWHEILFLHWSVPPEAVRPMVDARLGIDLFDGRAFVSLTPFTVRGARLRGAPAVPFVSDFHELNFRTYVRAGGGAAGVWFFSLDAASAVASALARAGLGLPYRVARMERSVAGSTHEFRSERVALRAQPVSFAARWTVGPLRADRVPGSLEHFLVERYALYSTHAGRLLRVRVRHRPWVLRDATVERLEETLTSGVRLAAAAEPPLVQFSSGVDVEFFPPEVVR